MANSDQSSIAELQRRLRAEGREAVFSEDERYEVWGWRDGEIVETALHNERDRARAAGDEMASRGLDVEWFERGKWLGWISPVYVPQEGDDDA